MGLEGENLLAGGINTEKSRKGELSSRLILTRRLADMFGGLGDIEQIINDLEHEADRLPEIGERAELL